MSIIRRLLSVSLILSLVLLAGRLAGFLREVLLSANFGVSAEADFAVVMLTTPDLLVNLLLAGGLSAALIPEFARLDRGGQTQLLVRSGTAILLLFGTVGVLIALFPSLLIWLFAPGYAATPVRTYFAPFAVAGLTVPLAGLVGVTTSFLNANQRFLLAGSGTLIFNGTLIAVLLFTTAGQDNALLLLSGGIAVAGLLRLGSQMMLCAPNLSWKPSLVPPTEWSSLAKRFLQALGASTLMLMVPVLVRSAVSLVGTGNIAAYNYATKLIELPVGIAITTISTVAFPAISRALAEDAPTTGRGLFAEGLVRALSVALAITVPSIVFADELVRLVFGHGGIAEQDLAVIAGFARLSLCALPAIAVSSMATALLNAESRTGIQLKLALLCTLIVPAAAVLGLGAGSAELIVLAFPAFHYAYAAALAYVVRPSLPRVSTLGRDGVLVPALIAGVVAASAWGIVRAANLPQPLLEGGLAALAVLASILCVSLSRRWLAKERCAA